MEKLKQILNKIGNFLKPIPVFFWTRLKNFQNWTSVRAVYLLMSLVLLVGLILNNWWVVVFVIFMLNIGVWTKKCPSKWVFEKLGLRKSEL